MPRLSVKQQRETTRGDEKTTGWKGNNGLGMKRVGGTNGRGDQLLRYRNRSPKAKSTIRTGRRTEPTKPPARGASPLRGS